MIEKKKNKEFTLKDKNGNTIDVDRINVIDSKENVYSEDLLHELDNNKHNLKNNLETKFISDQKINNLSDIFGKNNIIYDNQGPYKIKGDITCNKDITIVDPRGNEITVNLFELIDQNFGNVLAEYADHYRLTTWMMRKSDIIGSSIISVIKSIDYSKFSIDPTNCNLNFEYYSPGSWVPPAWARKIPQDFKLNINQIITHSVNEKFKNFFKCLFEGNWDPHKPQLRADLINLFKTSYDIEQRRNVKINTLLDKTRKWLKESPSQSGGAVSQNLYQLPNEWETIHENIEKINNEIDNLNDEEFINILNDSQNFKDKVNVEIMLNILENEII